MIKVDEWTRYPKLPDRTGYFIVSCEGFETSRPAAFDARLMQWIGVEGVYAWTEFFAAASPPPRVLGPDCICHQTECDRPAVFRYVWTCLDDEQPICEICAGKMQQIAQALGHYVNFIPLKQPEATSHATPAT